MSEIPKFFVPAATNADQEQLYANFAKACGVPVPVLAERICSIAFRHNGDPWTATVGNVLSGTHYVRKGSREYPQGKSDPAIVLAIFPGNPYQVFTSGGIAHQTAWANPFYVGEPDGVTLFSS